MARIKQELNKTSQNAIQRLERKMKIEYLGHSCFKINDELVIDPYKDGSVPGLEPLQTSGVKVICTHEHVDHSGRECVELVPGECELEIKEVASFHDDQKGALRGPNTIFVITNEAGEKLVSAEK